MSISALIVAAGRGVRAGGDVPKQWQALAGRRVADHTIAAFDRHPDIDRVILVLHPDDLQAQAEFTAAGYSIALGGATRAASVLNGLKALEGTGTTKVLIHDVARPCVSQAVISDVIAALETHPAAAPALPVTDALWTGQDGLVTGTTDRTGLYRAQTPQGFDYDTILAAHAASTGEPADDVEVARAFGVPVQITQGDANNIKITTPADFAQAEQILGRSMDIRVGNGFDVHRFGEGDHVMLCGVSIPFSRGLQGHSDADVGLHTITDAVYGALAMGDIGRHFPPSDPQWKGAESHIFLRHATDLAAEMGFTINNVDCTLICEEPKIGPHADAMIAVVAEIMSMEPSRVSIKATTSEKLGFTGRGEGIAAQATVTLVKP